MLLLADPATADETFRINNLQGNSLSNSLPIEVFHHPDGSYSVNIELCYQRVDEGLGPRASSGINVSACPTAGNRCSSASRISTCCSTPIRANGSQRPAPHRGCPLPS